MFFRKFLFGSLMLMSSVVLAQEVTSEPSTLKANLRRLGLEMSSTKVNNASDYLDSPVSQFNSDSQTIIKGVLDAALEYDRTNLNWTNSLLLEYGKTKLKSPTGERSSNENADQILFTSEYTHKVWSYKSLDFGPFVSAGYQTEFTDSQEAPRTKILRGKGGVKLFNGEILKDLYLAAVYEYDMTHPEKVSKCAGEFGWRAEYTLRDGINFNTDGYFRDYWSYSQYIGQDLEYDFKATGRMDVMLIDNLSFGPYVSYRQGQSREASKRASNLMIGISLTYKNLYDIF